MAEEQLRDSRQLLIGYLKKRFDGKTVLLDKNRRTLGIYDPTKDITYTPNMLTVGRGNLLASLLR